jgi:hypothetical protein
MPVLESALLGQWLVAQRHQLLRFLAQTREAHPSQVKFILPIPPFSFPSMSSTNGGNPNVRTGGLNQPQHIVLTKHQIRILSLGCIISSNSASSFLKLSSAAKSIKADSDESNMVLLLRPQREMRRFVIVHKILFAGVVDPEAIITRLPEEAVCSLRTIRHYRQRLLDATLLQMLTEHLRM